MVQGIMKDTPNSIYYSFNKLAIKKINFVKQATHLISFDSKFVRLVMFYSVWLQKMNEKLHLAIFKQVEKVSNEEPQLIKFVLVDFVLLYAQFILILIYCINI